eukprot:scaffold254914_cov41-Tisochrysis_lutea.AAC.5
MTVLRGKLLQCPSCLREEQCGVISHLAISIACLRVTLADHGGRRRLHQYTPFLSCVHEFLFRLLQPHGSERATSGA